LLLQALLCVIWEQQQSLLTVPPACKMDEVHADQAAAAQQMWWCNSASWSAGADPGLTAPKHVELSSLCPGRMPTADHCLHLLPTLSKAHHPLCLQCCNARTPAQHTPKYCNNQRFFYVCTWWHCWEIISSAANIMWLEGCFCPALLQLSADQVLCLITRSPS